MTKIDFYIIEKGSEQAAETFICRLTEKAWSQNNAVYIHSMDEQHATKYDELLWAFNDSSFVPHQLMHNEIDQSKTKNIRMLQNGNLCQSLLSHLKLFTDYGKQRL